MLSRSQPRAKTRPNVNATHRDGGEGPDWSPSLEKNSKIVSGQNPVGIFFGNLADLLGNLEKVKTLPFE